MSLVASLCLTYIDPCFCVERNGRTVFLLKESAKPVTERSKRRKIEICAEPPRRQQQQEERKQEAPFGMPGGAGGQQPAGADSEMFGEQAQPNAFMSTRAQKKGGPTK